MADLTGESAALRAARARYATADGPEDIDLGVYIVDGRSMYPCADGALGIMGGGNAEDTAADLAHEAYEAVTRLPREHVQLNARDAEAVQRMDRAELFRAHAFVPVFVYE